MAASSLWHIVKLFRYRGMSGSGNILLLMNRGLEDLSKMFIATVQLSKSSISRYNYQCHSLMTLHSQL